MSDTFLRACPFCASKKISNGEISPEASNGMVYTQAKCERCGALGPKVETPKASLDMALFYAREDWSRRPPLAALQALEREEIGTEAPSRARWEVRFFYGSEGGEPHSMIAIGPDNVRRKVESLDKVKTSVPHRTVVALAHALVDAQNWADAEIARLEWELVLLRNSLARSAAAISTLTASPADADKKEAAP